MCRFREILATDDAAGAVAQAAEDIGSCRDANRGSPHLSSPAAAAAAGDRLALAYGSTTQTFDKVPPAKLHLLLDLLVDSHDFDTVQAVTVSPQEYRQARLLRFKEKKHNRSARKQAGSRLHSPAEAASVKCANCGTREADTPLMRRGPGGPHTLCNACGIMFAAKGVLRAPPPPGRRTRGQNPWKSQLPAAAADAFKSLRGLSLACSAASPQQSAGRNLVLPLPGLQPEPLLPLLLQGVLQQQQPPPPAAMDAPQQQLSQPESQHLTAAAEGGSRAVPPAKRHHSLDAADVAAWRLQSPFVSPFQQQQQQQASLQAPQTPPRASPLGGAPPCSSDECDSDGARAAAPAAAPEGEARSPVPQTGLRDLLTAGSLGAGSSSNSAPLQMPSRGEAADMLAATDLLLSAGDGCAVDTVMLPSVGHLPRLPWYAPCQ